MSAITRTATGSRQTTVGVSVPKRATSADVAREARVSRSTVSFVLNNNPNQTIPEGTRQRVLDAAARLRYSPSASARTLRRGRSDVVLALLPAERAPHEQFMSLVEHFAEALAAAGLTLVTHPWQRGRPLACLWQAIAPRAVVALNLNADEIGMMADAGVEVVLQMLGGNDPLARWGQGVQAEIARVQVQGLVARGHSRLGFAMPADQRLQQEGSIRLGALEKICADAALPAPVSFVVPTEAEGAAEAVAAWLGQHLPITGVCAFDDTTALAILAGLRRHGLTAPEGLAVVGVYDTPAGRLSAPTLSTVSIDSAAMANHAATVLFGRLEGRPDQDLQGPETAKLIFRESS